MGDRTSSDGTALDGITVKYGQFTIQRSSTQWYRILNVVQLYQLYRPETGPMQQLRTDSGYTLGIYPV